MRAWRSNFIIILMFLISAAVAGRLIYVQIINHQYWKAFAQGQQNKFENFSGERGKIFLSGNFLPVATNRDFFAVFISPPEIEEKDKVVKFLSETLGLGEEAISQKIDNKETFFSVIKSHLTDSEIEKIEKENLDGVYLDSGRERYYPQDALISDILGFVDSDGNGQYGLEGYYNNILKGKEEFAQGERGPRGFLFFLNNDYNYGSDLTLTIDYNIQFRAEKLLKEAQENLKIDGGQIIVVDPITGKIIAMADFPYFNPNQYSGYAKEGNFDVFQNSATQKTFEPGSVFKPITMAMGLETGKISPQTTYNDPGVIKIDGWKIYNYAQRKYDGDITMTQVLEKSINTGAVFVEEMIPHDTFLDYVEKFGFLEKTDIDLPEVYSENSELKKGYNINFATVSFGQGIEITPVQLVRAFCAIANGGKLPKLYLVDKKIENGKEIETNPEFSEQIISEKTASQLAAMMTSVVENGYGTSAKIPGYYIGGKTGTAQVPFSALGINKSGYSDETIQSFIGFAPAFNPKFLILVKLDNPQSKTAEYSAVPIFRDLAEYIINLWQIQPDYDANK